LNSERRVGKASVGWAKARSGAYPSVDGKDATPAADSTIARVARRLADDIRISAAIGSSEPFGDKWFKSLTAFGGFFDGTIPESYNVCHSPSRMEKPGELVRVYWHANYLPSRLQELSNVVRLEIEPFIIGVGYVTTENIPEGGIVVCRQDSDRLGVVEHD
jgi:hypothetical protein